RGLARPLPPAVRLDADAARAAKRRVVGADLLAVSGIVHARLVELRRALHGVLRPLDVDLLLVGMHPVDDPGREQDLLAEDPRSRLDDDADAVDALPHLDDVAHRTVERLDRVAVEVDVVPPRLAEAPELNHRHATSFACVPTGSVTPVVGSQPERSGGE